MRKTFLAVNAVFLLLVLLGCGGGKAFIIESEERSVEHFNNGVRFLEMKRYAEAEKEFDLSNRENMRGWEKSNEYTYDFSTGWEIASHYKERNCLSLLNRGIARYYQGKRAEAKKDLEFVVKMGDPDGYRTFPCAGARENALKTLKEMERTSFENIIKPGLK
jgi:lipoprotein NlpI